MQLLVRFSIDHPRPSYWILHILINVRHNICIPFLDIIQHIFFVWFNTIGQIDDYSIVVEMAFGRLLVLEKNALHFERINKLKRQMNRKWMIAII